jgi:hypothetical protein
MLLNDGGKHLRRHSGARRSREPGIHNPPRVRLAAFAEKEKARAFLVLREWPKGQARCGYGFRACASRAK